MKTNSENQNTNNLVENEGQNMDIVSEESNKEGLSPEGFSNQTQEERLMGLLFRSSHIMHHRRGRKQHGQGGILQILAKKETITQRELLDIAGTRSASLSELLGKMEASGYIKREKNSEDKRNVDITLTEEGKKAAQELKDERDKTAEKLFTNLDDEEKEQLEELLTKLLTAWKQDGEISGNHRRREHCSRHGRGEGHGPHGHGRGHGEGHRRSHGEECCHREGHGHNRNRGGHEQYGEGHKHDESCIRGEGHTHGSSERCERGRGEGHEHSHKQGENCERREQVPGQAHKHGEECRRDRRHDGEDRKHDRSEGRGRNQREEQNHDRDEREGQKEE